MVLTNGRQPCMARTIESFNKSWRYPIDQKVIVDDSQVPRYRRWLLGAYPDWNIVSSQTSLGFHGAIQRAWDEITPTDFVFHLEDDFTFTEPVDVQKMMRILGENPMVAQVALKRQPWSKPEIDAGGICEAWPDEFTDQDGWCEHNLFFTTNPSLYPWSLTKFGWPQQEQSERAFTEILLAKGMRFAYYGHKFDPPRVLHIGNQRTGTGY